MLTLVISGCRRSEKPHTFAAANHLQTEVAPQARSSADNSELPTQLAQNITLAKGHVGVFALVLETGQTVVINSHDLSSKSRLLVFFAAHCFRIMVDTW